MSEFEPKLPRRKQLGLESASAHDGTTALKSTHERLKQGGAYQPGDLLYWYNNEGKRQVVRVDTVIAEDSTLIIQPSHADYGTANFETNSDRSLPPHQVIDQQQMDKYCRGTRADIAQLLHKLFDQITGLTEALPMEQIREAIATGDYSKIPKLQTHILRDGLQQAIKDFYYTDSPDYQALIDAIAAIADHSNSTVKDRTGFQFTSIRSLTDVHTLLQEIFGPIEISPDADITVTSAVMSKYASRLSVCGQAALAVFQTWLKENPQSWQMGEAVSE